MERHACKMLWQREMRRAKSLGKLREREREVERKRKKETEKGEDGDGDGDGNVISV